MTETQTATSTRMDQLPVETHARNPGMALDLDWVASVQANQSAIERRQQFSEPGEVLDTDENVSVEQAIEDYMKYLEKGDKIKIREYSLFGEDENSGGGEDGEEEQPKAYTSMGVNVSFSGMNIPERIST